MTEDHLIHGGCLCGAIRYTVEGPAVHTSLCHCSDCRRASGAAAAAWTFFHTGNLKWTEGRPRCVQFAGRERYFCGDCGTPLRFRDPGLADWLEMNTCTFDSPSSFPPADECWTEDRLPWVKPIQGIPSYPRDAPLPEVP